MYYKRQWLYLERKVKEMLSQAQSGDTCYALNEILDWMEARGKEIKFPDDSITEEEMYEYGYLWDGMLPMEKEAALKLFGKFMIYRLYEDDSDGIVNNTDEIEEHAKVGGIFGVEAGDWWDAY